MKEFCNFVSSTGGSQFRNHNNGQAMIESIVAISVSVIGLLGILAMLGYSLNTNRNVSRKFVATYLAAEGIEIVKSLIDKNYATLRCSWNGGGGSCVSISKTGSPYQVAYSDNSLSNYTGAPLKFDDVKKTYNYVGGILTPFTREITIAEKGINATAGTDEIVVHSIVSWSENGAPKSVDLEDHFFDWRL